jgi:cytochrome c
MSRFLSSAFVTLVAITLLHPAYAAEGDPVRGQRAFGICAACHSLEPNRNMTGPSLFELWNRSAGSLSSFPRYSPALTSAGVIWADKTLDEWLKDPQHFIPGNTMTFPGVKDEQSRTDLLAFLKDATRPGATAPAPSAQPQPPMGGMMGMMGGGRVANLKKLDPQEHVRSIKHCGDTYKVTTADGKIRDFWDRNLRFKTDGSDDGPEKGAPALVGAGMLGDRADVIFASPEEISGFISRGC